jgi:hypothetical protein
VARKGGVYGVTRGLLGRFGGVFRGTVMHIEPTRGFFVADVFWLPPNGTPIGPMALEIACRLGVTPDGLPCSKVRVTQGGFEESARWRRYYEVAQAEWQKQLESLKRRCFARPLQIQAAGAKTRCGNSLCNEVAGMGQLLHRPFE